MMIIPVPQIYTSPGRPESTSQDGTWGWDIAHLLGLISVPPTSFMLKNRVLTPLPQNVPVLEEGFLKKLK